MRKVIDYTRPTAWAAFALNGNPMPFTHDGSVRSHRRDVIAFIGAAWAREGETVARGWRRAYSAGWRTTKVTICPASPLPSSH